MDLPVGTLEWGKVKSSSIVGVIFTFSSSSPFSGFSFLFYPIFHRIVLELRFLSMFCSVSFV